MPGAVFGLLFLFALLRYCPEAVADMRGTRTGRHKRRMLKMRQQHEKEMERLRQDKPLLADTLHERLTRPRHQPRPRPDYAEMRGLRRFLAVWGSDASDWATAKRRNLARWGGEARYDTSESARNAYWRMRGYPDAGPLGPVGNVADPVDPEGQAQRDHFAEQAQRQRDHEATEAEAQREHERRMADQLAPPHTQIPQTAGAAGAPPNHFAPGERSSDPTTNTQQTPTNTVQADAQRTDQHDQTVGADGNPIVDAEVVDEPTNTNTDADLASVTPINRNTAQDGENTMTAAAEGGLSASRQYAADMLATIDSNTSGLETTAGSLETAQWTGDAPGGFREAMEHFAAAKAAIERSDAALAKGENVKDAYTAAPETGSRESVLAE